MNGEIEFFRKCLEKGGIQTLLESRDRNNTLFDYGIRKVASENLTLNAFLSFHYTRSDKPRMIHIFDRFVLSYLVLELKEDRLIVGPYVLSMPTEEMISTIAEGVELEKEKRSTLSSIYYRIPEVKDEQFLISASSALMDENWGIDGWTHEDIRVDIYEMKTFKKNSRNGDMEKVETSYRIENLMLDAVSRGDVSYIQKLTKNLKDMNMALRVPDPVRNFKNYLIIMNTLLRKAAEGGGVTIAEIDRLSSRFAHSIEDCRTIEKLMKVGANMPLSYVIMVRNNKFSNYSTIVTRALSIMEEDRTSRLGDVAEKLSVTPGWLSTCISRDTGLSFSEMMMKIRADYAGIELITTRHSMEEIAENAGFNDVSYFSRVFKKIKGKTPTHWREEGVRISS